MEVFHPKQALQANHVVKISPLQVIRHDNAAEARKFNSDGRCMYEDPDRTVHCDIFSYCFATATN